MAQVQWFGRSWGAPVCDDTQNIYVPVGDPCVFCEKPLDNDDQGLMMDYLGKDGDSRKPAHLQCLLRNVVGYARAGQ